MEKSMSSAVHTLAWYVRRPSMYRELARRIGRYSLGERRRGNGARIVKDETSSWCRSVRVPVEEAMRQLALPTAVERLADIHPDVWAAARAAFDACRGTMGGPAHVDLLYHLVRQTGARAVVETGVAAGWSSMAILTAMADAGTSGHLTSVDMPYPKRANEHLVGCVVPESLHDHWDLVRLPDRDALPAILNHRTIGFAHYDSDKSYAGRMFGYARLWEALEPGGVLMSDDVEDNFGFRDFARAVGRHPLVVGKGDGGYAGLLRK